MSFDQEANSAQQRPRINTDSVFAEVREGIARVVQGVKIIEKGNKEIGTRRDNSTFREELSETIAAVRRDCASISQLLKQLSPTLGTQEARLTHGKLTKDFQQVLTRFREVTKHTMDQETSTPVPKPAQDVDESTSLLEQQRLHELMMQQQAATHNNALIEDREHGMKQIEKTMSDVHGIMQDMASLVAQQGVWVDDIESNITATYEETAKANQELRSASASQKKSRTKLCIIIIVLVLLAGGIGAAAAITGGFKHG